jgi:Fur family ferric uptake transcriptional regulator
MPRKSRKTRQKEIIESSLQDVEAFFTAEDLHSAVIEKDSSVGIATVYRFLKEKSEDAQLHSYRCEGRRIYSIEKRNHAHFICTDCGSTTHFNIGDIGEIKKSVKGEICHLQLDVYGICEKCKNNRSRSLEHERKVSH